MRASRFNAMVARKILKQNKHFRIVVFPAPAGNAIPLSKACQKIYQCTYVLTYSFFGNMKTCLGIPTGHLIARINCSQEFFFILYFLS